MICSGPLKLTSSVDSNSSRHDSTSHPDAGDSASRNTSDPRVFLLDDIGDRFFQQRRLNVDKQH
jgi:hypothetical protein